MLGHDLTLQVVPGWWSPRARRLASVGLALATSAVFLAMLMIALGPATVEPPPGAETGIDLLDLVPVVFFPLAYGAVVELPRSWLSHRAGREATRARR
jgi:hypothetical protein